MLEQYAIHNQFKLNLVTFQKDDPHLRSLTQLKYQYTSYWWTALELTTPGIYILTGGRQVGKSTSCKQLIEHCIKGLHFKPEHVLYLPCDEIYDAKTLSQTLRFFMDNVGNTRFLLMIDEVTFVKDWDRVIKALADEGYFKRGVCLLTGSDTLILKEAAMRFPGRRGAANQTDFHLYPLTFKNYLDLIESDKNPSIETKAKHFYDYLRCGGYLRAINDLAENNEVSVATFQTYEQWIRGDFLKQGRSEETLFAILRALFTINVSQISYSSLTQKIGSISKETCIDYCRLLERMDVLFSLQAYDQNKKQGFPRKARKFHFFDPFIFLTLLHWLKREINFEFKHLESHLTEACVASHCHRFAKTYYFKGQGEVDVIWLKDKDPQAIEVKWANQLRPADLKTLRNFSESVILTKSTIQGQVEGIKTIPVYEFLSSEHFN